MNSWRRLTPVLLALTLVGAACGDDGGGGIFAPPTSTAGPTATATTAPPATAATTTSTEATPPTLPPATTTSTTEAAATTTVATTVPELDPGTAYSEYELITDDSGLIEVSVPVEWADRLGIPWDRDGELIGPAMSAAPDRQAWLEGWSTPGVFMAASAELDLTVDELLDDLVFSQSCDYLGRDDYDDGEYRGVFDTWFDCGEASSEFLLIATEPYAGGAIVLVEVIVVTEADFEALDMVLASFRLIGDLSG